MADVERGWFRRGLAQESVDPIYSSEADPDGDFDNVETADADEAFATWRAACEEARAILAAHALDDIFPRGSTGQTISARWMLTHMVEEYSRHNGHADLLRQQIDGAVGY
jgi:hypothetical protein